MPTYRIEFRSHNIAAGSGPGSAPGIGFAHNFLVLVEVGAGNEPRVLGELHGFPLNPKTRAPQFGVGGMTSGGPLGLVERNFPKGTTYYAESLSQPSYILFQGHKAEAVARFEKARQAGKWITAQNFQYSPVGRNSNAFANTIARVAGYDVTGQPIDRATGRHIEAPSRGMDLREGRRGAPVPFTDRPERVFGYGDQGKKSQRPIPPEREAPPYDGPELPRHGAVPASAAPASYRLGFENARRFADEHRFDPSAEPALSREQNKIVSTRVERALGPAVAHERLPRGLAGDVLDHAARTTPHEAALALQEGLNRLTGAAQFGKTAPAFADGSAKRVAEDGWIGPETLAAVEKHAAESGLGRMRESAALAAFRRGLDALAGGGTDASEAPAVFRRSIGRLYRDPSAPPVWPGSRPRHDEVAALQESINDANRIFAFTAEPLVVDGDLGPKTGAALVKAARAAGSERLTDHVGKRLGIGERDLLHDPARGFGRALEEEDDDAPALRALA
jgi:hypothetical protein